MSSRLDAPPIVYAPDWQYNLKFPPLLTTPLHTIPPLRSIDSMSATDRTKVDSTYSQQQAYASLFSSAYDFVNIGGRKQRSVVKVIFAGLLIDGTGAEPQRDVTIIIKDNTILKIGHKDDKQIVYPSDALVIDLSLQVVMPGFVDTHVHLLIEAGDYQMDHLRQSSTQQVLRGITRARALLHYGFTTLRIAGEPDGETQYGASEVKQAIDDGYHIGPRLAVANHYLSITGGGGDINHISPHVHVAASYSASVTQRHHLADGVIVDGPAAMRRAVRLEKKFGSQWIKLLVTGAFMSTKDSPKNVHFSKEELAMCVAEAKRLKIPIMAHAHGAQGIIDAVNAGVDSIEHGSFINEEGCRLMKKHNCFLVPTLTVGEYGSTSWSSDGEQSKFVELHKTTEAEHIACMKLAVENQVKIAFGSDYVGWDPSLNAREFELLHYQMGLSAMECIKAGTGNAGELLARNQKWAGRSSIGTIREGGLADLVAIQGGNPLDNISLLRTGVCFVMIDGNVVRHDARDIKLSWPYDPRVCISNNDFNNSPDNYIHHNTPDFEATKLCQSKLHPVASFYPSSMAETRTPPVQSSATQLGAGRLAAKL